VPQCNIVSCKEFNIISCDSIIEQNSLFHLVKGSKKIPDHSLLFMKFDLGLCLECKLEHNSDCDISPNVRFNLKYIPPDILNNVNVSRNLEDFKDTIASVQNQTEMDQNYKFFSRSNYILS
jgi:hypothetical protein